MLFLSVHRFFDYAGPVGHSRLTRPPVLPSPLRQKVGVLIHRLFEAQSPGPPIPLSTLRATPHGVARKTRGQNGFAVLLSCRALSSPTTCRFIPALDVLSRSRTSEFMAPAGRLASSVLGKVYICEVNPFSGPIGGAVPGQGTLRAKTAQAGFRRKESRVAAE